MRSKKDGQANPATGGSTEADGGKEWPPVPNEGPPLRLGAMGRTLVPGWSEWVRSGTPAADWGIVISGFMGPVARMEAVRRILARLGGPPIGPRRWTRNQQRLLSALEGLAPSHGDGTAAIQPLAEARTWEVVHELMDELREYAAPESTVNEYAAGLQSILERILCEDLLGRRWRNKYEQSMVHWDEEAEPSSALAIERLSFVEAVKVTGDIIESLSLTPAERELWAAFFPTRDWADAEELLGIEPTAFRQRKSRLLKKLGPLREELESP